MPKRTDIQKILIIGSGPIIIGQSCEFDYSGTQALKALKKEGYKVILINSNPATIMTDPQFADRTYIEPLTPQALEEIIKIEKPDAILPTLGGQTALNLATKLYEKGILSKYKVELIGANIHSIQKAENRELFKKTMIEAGLEVPKSGYAKGIAEAEKILQQIGFPLIIRPSFCLGGHGSFVVYTHDEFFDAVDKALQTSPVHEILIEESLLGWKEYELEVMRDKNDNCVVICSIENFDPMGVHTGDSITVAPAQTLTDKEYQKMRSWAFKVIRAIGVDTGGSNIQFAVNPQNGRMVVIEMNPRVSRSSALASKATGFPIAKIAALLAVGYSLDEIPNDITKKTPACFEPAIDYIVVKIPRFAFEKFTKASQTLTTSMKSVGEVMAIGRTFPEAIQKAIRGLEIGRFGLGADGLGQVPKIEQAIKNPQLKDKVLEEVKQKLIIPNCDRIFNIKYALMLGLKPDEISKLSSIDVWFINQIKRLVDFENEIGKLTPEIFKKAKQLGYTNYQISYLTKTPIKKINKLQKKFKIYPTYKSVDTCAAEFYAYTPYFYSCYETQNDSTPLKKKGIVILGGGPNRIGQGIEFDYCCVHCSFALSEEGFKTIMVNCNPETVSTDYDTSDKLYFEPITYEDVINIIKHETPFGVIVQFGGQTPLNITNELYNWGVKILGTPPSSIDLAEDRIRFGNFLKKLGIKHPPFGSAKNFPQAQELVKNIGYPVIVRPSYVLGGRAMEVVYNDEELSHYLKMATDISPRHPVLIDKFLDNSIEIDVDAICDSKSVFIPAIMEHIEPAGIHSGDSACVIPPVNLNKDVIEKIKKITETIALKLKVQGLINLQLIYKDGEIFVLEANPRASRTVPFISKSTGIPLAKLAAKIMIGKKIKDLISPYIKKQINWWSVKEVVLPFIRFPEVDTILGPEMRSTGEVMGIDFNWELAYAKSQIAAGSDFNFDGAILFSLKDDDKSKALKIATEFKKLGFQIFATENTARFFSQNNIEVEVVRKISEGRPNLIDLIKNKKFSLVINTPSPSENSQTQGYMIRRTALENNIPIVTTLQAASAYFDSIKILKSKKTKYLAIQDLY